jgi:hypothetical protein
MKPILNRRELARLQGLVPENVFERLPVLLTAAALTSADLQLIDEIRDLCMMEAVRIGMDAQHDITPDGELLETIGDKLFEWIERVRERPPTFPA